MNFNVSGKLTNTGGGALVPIGTVLEFAGSTAPLNYLMCNGQAVSRTTYSELFSVIGTTYGSGDGSTTFNVPDRRGKVGVGYGNGLAIYSYANQLGHTDGSKDAVVVSHNHVVNTSCGAAGAHNHTRGSMNITGAFHIRHCASSGNPATVANEQIGALKGEGFDTGYSQWSNGLSMQSWKYYPEKVTFDASRNWTGETSWKEDHTHSIGVTIQSNGESGTNKNLQPYIVQNYIIRAK